MKESFLSLKLKASKGCKQQFCVGSDQRVEHSSIGSDLRFGTDSCFVSVVVAEIEEETGREAQFVHSKLV